MFARTPASPPCSCPLRLSPSGKTVDPEAPLPASPVCDRDSTRRFHGAHSRLIRLLHSSPHPPPTPHPPPAPPAPIGQTVGDRGRRCPPASAWPHAPGAGTTCISCISA